MRMTIINKPMRKASYLIMTVILVLGILRLPSSAEPIEIGYNKAAGLNSLGLFSGTGNGFELENKATRIEGAVMLVKLLGLEKEALSGAVDHPFIDVPEWAGKSVSVLYRHHLIKGTSLNTFGSKDPLTGRQYLMFVMRSLGYSDSSDFTWQTAFAKAVALGLADAEEKSRFESSSPLLRNEVVLISDSALKTDKKSSNYSLLDTLVIQSVVDPDKAAIWFADNLVKKITKISDSEYAKVKIFHDYLVSQNDYGYLDSEIDPNQVLVQTAYSTLSLNKGLCGSYAKAMKALCDRAGIACNVLLGQANGSNGWSLHAWNVLRKDNQWYHTDVTFDDPQNLKVIRYNYFNVTDKELMIDHSWGAELAPVCTATAANLYYRSGLVVDSWDGFKNTLVTMVENRVIETSLKIQPWNSTIYTSAAIRSILVQTGKVAQFSHSIDPVMGVVRITNVKYFNTPVAQTPVK